MLRITNRSFVESHSRLKEKLSSICEDSKSVTIPVEDFVNGTRFGYGQTEENRLIEFMNIVPMKDPLLTICEELSDQTVRPQQIPLKTISTELAVVSEFGRQPKDQRVADGLRCLVALRRKISQKIINGSSANEEPVGFINLEGIERTEIGDLSEEAILQVLTKAHVVADCPASCFILNVEDSMILRGPSANTTRLWNVQMLSSSTVPKGAVLSGNFWNHAVLAMGPVRLRVTRAHKMEAAIDTALGCYKPSAFVLAEIATSVETAG